MLCWVDFSRRFWDIDDGRHREGDEIGDDAGRGTRGWSAELRVEAVLLIGFGGSGERQDEEVAALLKGKEVANADQLIPETETTTGDAQVCPQDQVVAEQPENIIEASKVKRRGTTTGASVEKERRKTTSGKLDIIIHPIRNRIVGDNARHFKTEATTVIKQHAPRHFGRWKEIPVDIKMKMWLAMKQKFNLGDDMQVKKVVFEQMNRQYRSYRHKLHIYYTKNKDHENILGKPPSSVRPSDWPILVKFFEGNDAFKHTSARNKQNRQKLKMAHTCGTKSIAQYCYEERDPVTHEEPSRTSTWRKTRYSNKKKEWVDESSREVYEEIIRLQSEVHEGNHDIMSEDEAFIKVLGQEKPNRLRGCGDGLKPISKRGNGVNEELRKENEELKKQSEKMASRLQSLETQLSNQEIQVQTQVAAQVQDILRSQLPTMLQNLGHTSQLPTS
ncbi:Unknown protein [Striga hermonthica]|uniref:Transposase n=1 Tax=Striga hermonthica TaxID=68872 RepID=A0A9N7NCR9_STRHE|nr:Unknown protein [Striga hermonthica]